MKLNAEEIQKIKTAIIGAKVSCGYRSPYNGARIVTNTGSIKNFSLKWKSPLDDYHRFR